MSTYNDNNLCTKCIYIKYLQTIKAIERSIFYDSIIILSIVCIDVDLRFKGVVWHVYLPYRYSTLPGVNRSYETFSGYQFFLLSSDKVTRQNISKSVSIVKTKLIVKFYNTVTFNFVHWMSINEPSQECSCCIYVSVVI